MSEPDVASRRLFFALWPDESVRQQIDSAAFPRLSQNRSPRAHWHMTLVFLGLTQTVQQRNLERAAASIVAAPFDLQLDTTGQFSRAHIGWLGCVQSSPALFNFQNRLESALRDCCPSHPAFVTAQHSFCPHITLYRHVKAYPRVVLAVPVNWRISSFSLIESRRGEKPVYRTLKNWSLVA